MTRNRPPSKNSDPRSSRRKPANAASMRESKPARSNDRADEKKRNRGGNQNFSTQRRNGGNRSANNESLFLYGIHTVRAALENPKRKKIRLCVTENAQARLGKDLIAGSGITVELYPARSLDQMVGTDAVHQGVGAGVHATGSA